MSFNSKRLELARKRRQLSGKVLAEIVGVSEVTISRLGSSLNEPTPQTISKIANALNYPVAFFYEDECEDIAPETVSFRSLKKMTSKVRDSAIAGGCLGLLLSDWLESAFNLPTPDLLDLSKESEPETAAAILRQYWGLGERPIPNMIHLLELKGVRVFSLAEGSDAVDAFSYWKGEKPYIFLNTFKTAEHSRFDAAHELGHLVLHRHGAAYVPNVVKDATTKSPRTYLDEDKYEPEFVFKSQKSKLTLEERDVEREADRFASAFLMPRHDVLAQAPKLTLTVSIIQAKARWKVSAMALAYRLRALGRLTEWQYRTIVIELSQLGYRKAEPQGIEQETSFIWQKVLQHLWQEKKTKADIAKQLNIPLDELESLIFGILERKNVNHKDAITNNLSKLYSVK